MDTEPVEPLSPAEQLDVPLMPELKTVYLGGLFLLAVLAALHAASEIVIPVVLAFILKLVLQPLQRLLEKIRIPRMLASLAIVLMLIGGGAALGSLLSGPAASWAEQLPESFPRLRERLGFIGDPLKSAQKFIVDAENMTQSGGPKVMAVAVQGTRLSDRVFTGTRAFVSALLTTVLVLFFLLAGGDTFLRRLVEILPRFSEKRQAVDISQQIEHDISVYLMTITFMNACVGAATGAVMFLCGWEDAVLWATLAFLLNYMPVLGPMIGAAVFALVGLLTVHDMGTAVLPAILYLGIHLTESMVVTPLLVARRFTLNPVLVILSLVFWYWMWGFAGAILAMPMLAVIKIICDRIEKLKPFGHFLEG